MQQKEMNTKQTCGLHFLKKVNIPKILLLSKKNQSIDKSRLTK